MKKLFQDAPRFLFVTGKGGVGKTSMACALAIALADAGKHVLLISTDPASNLDEVLETPLSTTPLPVKGVSGLLAMNIDPEAAAREYRERIVSPYRGILPDAAVQSIEEQLSGACTVEIASFNEFARLIGDESAIVGYDHVILDTAPTGHTLRLLSLPAAWDDFIASNQAGSSCLGPLSGLKEQHLVYERVVQALNDSTRTLLVLVTRPERSALAEAARTSAELKRLGMRRQRLIINGVFAATHSMDSFATAFERRSRLALAEMPKELRNFEQDQVSFRPRGFLGVKALRSAFQTEAVTGHGNGFLGGAVKIPVISTLTELVDDLAQAGSGVIMTMGKGGVGKTTLAAAIAVELARRGLPVHLSTTDPAAHVADAIGNIPAHLKVSRIDPVAETKAHVARTLAKAESKVDAEARALLEEELRSPCTEEVAVFQAFARTIAEGKNQFVVLDTAPTGHTLLLLDATEAYHREVLRSTSELPEFVRELLPRLRDPNFTKVLLVVLPESTPVHEAAQLQADLRRAGIEPHAWIINQSFARTKTSDPLLSQKAAHEARFICEVADDLAQKTVLVPWRPEELTGVENLRQLFLSEELVYAAAV